ncbi:FAD-dependent monooxygenase [Streptomyces albiaxialis]|uniref:FAD-dependent monooxygenase n=1 Tax=Streptomyces albiaxialis TaxID=329523 RepID=A0ABN2VRF2_9ACTN
MRILVPGTGVAGLALAVELTARGHEVSLIERAAEFRTGGTPIDIRGDALGVVARLGLLPRVREHRVDASERGVFVDAHGATVAPLPVEQVGDSDDDIEITRDDLARILVDALPPGVPIRFGDSVVALDENEDGGRVDVGFLSGHRESFDLVLGADGLHSAVRRLVFGPEADCVRHLGVHLGIAHVTDDAAGNTGGAGDTPSEFCNYPGHMAGFMRFKGETLALLAFRAGPIDHDHHDLAAQRRIVAEAFAGHTEWEIPRLLGAVRRDPAFYFDAISQIHLPAWHRGRVALVGDAAYCASPLSGRGTSLALTGAAFLAEALDRHPGDHTAAFEEYAARQRPYVEFAQASVDEGAGIVVPDSWEAIRARNEALGGAEAVESVR